MTRFKDSIFYISGNERLTDVHTEGDLTTVTLEKPVGDDTAYLKEFCDIDSYDTVVYVYECNAKTLEIESVTVKVSAGDSNLLVYNSTYNYSDDTLTTPGFVADLNNTAKTRTVTLHYNGITKYTIAKDAKFGITVPDGFALYSDPEGKKPLKDSEKAGANIEMYMLKTKEQ